MATDQDRAIDLNGDTRLNVASLLLEPVGATREIRVSLPRLELGDGLAATDVIAPARLTRLKGQILVKADVTGTVRLECVTCLTEYDQPIRESFSESFHQTVDVRTGSGLTKPRERLLAGDEDEEPGFVIDDNHEIDLAEALRQWIVLSIPMQPSCGPDCPGPLLRSTDPEQAGDARLAGLASLLDDDVELSDR
ncbi:MAG: hypothetical protein AVDCRST_MAG87-1070 [uncultured Thermomicrobiales bacterium]|uniref:COG1399 protein, clustered with ribosomal protein L32p n=1 Tax=uncultured Thermomicrobiales bacterium TaxID=1645740 RepID=A0A6J4ULJ0_9BACT|nr:MAG: hypothetical protein AVDCRST_MAG87-1070 [uncultured Thermomicrobiales bacterium]